MEAEMTNFALADMSEQIYSLDNEAARTVAMMKRAKRVRLEARGWRVGTAQDLLGLSDEEAAFVELKQALARGVRARRERSGWTQTRLANLLESSQSRVAKMEAADRTVSVDLLVRSLFAMGTTKRGLAKIISEQKRRRAA
jgi:hypothetical protein